MVQSFEAHEDELFRQQVEQVKQWWKASPHPPSSHPELARRALGRSSGHGMLTAGSPASCSRRASRASCARTRQRTSSRSGARSRSSTRRASRARSSGSSSTKSSRTASPATPTERASPPRSVSRQGRRRISVDDDGLNLGQRGALAGDTVCGGERPLGRLPAARTRLARNGRFDGMTN